MVCLSFVKDIERIGVHAENIYDLCAEDVELSGADDLLDVYDEERTTRE